MPCTQTKVLLNDMSNKIMTKPKSWFQPWSYRASELPLKCCSLSFPGNSLSLGTPEPHFYLFLIPAASPLLPTHDDECSQLLDLPNLPPDPSLHCLILPGGFLFPLRWALFSDYLPSWSPGHLPMGLLNFKGWISHNHVKLKCISIFSHLWSSFEGVKRSEEESWVNCFSQCMMYKHSETPTPFSLILFEFLFPLFFEYISHFPNRSLLQCVWEYSLYVWISL